jgi:hypothetical protein
MNASLRFEMFLDVDTSFAGTALPRSGAALYGHGDEMDRIVLAFEPEAEYLSALDGAAAILVPALRPLVLAYYRDDGPALEELWAPHEIESLDDWLATAIDISVNIAEAEIGSTARQLRSSVRQVVYLR